LSVYRGMKLLRGKDNKNFLKTPKRLKKIFLGGRSERVNLLCKTPRLVMGVKGTPHNFILVPITKYIFKQ